MVLLSTNPSQRAKCRRRGPIVVAWCAVTFAFLAGPSRLTAQVVPAAEYQVKAVFLFNFAQFIDWPSEAFSNVRSPLVIGVLGKDPFGPFLDQTIQGEIAHGRPVLVQRYRDIDEISACHILFIGRSEAGWLQQVLAGLKGLGLLTVSDIPDFARQGGMIQFMIEKNKIRLLINMEDVKASNLSISSKLLRLSQIVRPERD